MIPRRLWMDETTRCRRGHTQKFLLTGDGLLGRKTQIDVRGLEKRCILRIAEHRFFQATTLHVPD